MSDNWGKVVPRNYAKTGKMIRPLVGPFVDRTGEIVNYHSWGGVDVDFGDEVVTYANDDVDFIETPILKPCPFCASTEIRYSSEAAKTGLAENHVYWCGNCGAFGPNDISQKHARDMWNLRRA